MTQLFFLGIITIFASCGGKNIQDPNKYAEECAAESCACNSLKDINAIGSCQVKADRKFYNLAEDGYSKEEVEKARAIFDKLVESCSQEQEK